MNAGDWLTLGIAMVFVGYLIYMPYRQSVQSKRHARREHSNALGEQPHDREAYIRNGGLGAPGNDR